MDRQALEALLKHIGDMSHDYMAFFASANEQFYYLAELKRLARAIESTPTS